MGADVVCWECGGFESCTCELIPDEDVMVGQVTADAVEIMRGTTDEMDAKEWANKVDADNQKLLGRIEQMRVALTDIIEMSARDECGEPGEIETTARKALK